MTVKTRVVKVRCEQAFFSLFLQNYELFLCMLVFIRLTNQSLLFFLATAFLQDSKCKILSKCNQSFLKNNLEENKNLPHYTLYKNIN